MQDAHLNFPSDKTKKKSQCYTLARYSNSNGMSLEKLEASQETEVILTEFEVGGMISSFRHRNEYSSFHSFDDNKTSIKFTPWDKKAKIKKGDKDEWVILPAFGITFTRNGNQTFRIPLEPGEVENLTEFLRYFLKTLYSHRREQEEILLKEYRSKNSGQSNYNDASKSEDAPF